MFATNPFHDLPGAISPAEMQIYIAVMVLMVIGGTIIDVIHKKSAKYFVENSQKAQKSARRSVSGGEKISLALKVLFNEVLTSAEFDSTKRRISHLLTMYGFILFAAMTAVQIFAYPEAVTPTPAIVPSLWHIGAIMLCVGGYWFWFSIRADVSAEGNPWYRLVRADLFIVSLLATATFALIWSAMQANSANGWDTLFFALFIIAATALFSTVLWSKFAHMFFKPAAAYQKKITKADGSQENLPDLGSLTEPALQARYPDIPEYMGTNPPNMGLGIKREPSNHY